jgi:putative Holliday junction resolvase
MEMEEAREDIVTLVDEDGKEHEFAVVDIIEVDNKEYALLMPSEGEEGAEDEEVLVLRFEEDSLVMIEDEAEFNKVVQYLEELGEQEEE